MKIFITGATGLLGGNLVRHLWSKGERDLRVLVRASSKTLAIDDLQVERVPGDIRDPGSLAAAVSGVEQVHHCAASISQWQGNRRQSYEINVNGTVNVMEACLKAGVKRVVYVSTVDTLGFSSRENPADENWPEHQSMARMKNPYFDSKYDAEQEAKKFLSKGLDLVIVKPTTMIGEWDVKPATGQLIIPAARGLVKVYPGDGGGSFVDALDVCEGMRLAMQKGRTGEAYILGNERGNMTYREFFAMVAGLAGKSPPWIRMPKAIALLAGYAADAAGAVFRFEAEFNSSVARIAYANHYFTSRKAIAELGMPQSGIEGAVKRAVAWFTKYGYL